MPDPIIVAAHDPCPSCRGPLLPVPQLTDAERAKAADHENPVAYSERLDGASAETIADKGTLHRCLLCGWQARFKEAAEAVWPLTKRALEGAVLDVLKAHGLLGL